MMFQYLFEVLYKKFILCSIKANQFQILLEFFALYKIFSENLIQLHFTNAYKLFVYAMDNYTTIISYYTQPSTLNSVYAAIYTNPRSFYLTFIQPWFNILAIVGNFIVIIVFVFCLKPLGSSNSESGFRSSAGGLATVSRIYYTTIAFCELCASISGYFVRDTLYFLPVWVRLMML